MTAGTVFPQVSVAALEGGEEPLSPAGRPAETGNMTPMRATLAAWCAALLILAPNVAFAQEPPPVNGVLQTAFGTFIVGQGGGSVTVTLTSAVETLPSGMLLTTVTMGVGIGTVAGGICTLLPNAFTTAQSGSTPQLSGTLSAGTYCAQVSDVTSQLGPVAYALAVSHP